MLFTAPPACMLMIMLSMLSRLALLSPCLEFSCAVVNICPCSRILRLPILGSAALFSVGQGLLVLSCASPKRHLSATVTTSRLQQQLQLHQRLELRPQQQLHPQLFLHQQLHASLLYVVFFLLMRYSGIAADSNNDVPKSVLIKRRCLRTCI